MSIFRLRWLLVLVPLALVPASGALADVEWGPISGGGSVGFSNCASDSIHAFLSYEFNYEDDTESAAAREDDTGSAAEQEPDVGTLSARRRNGVDFEAGYIELDVPGQVERDPTELASIGYVRINFFGNTKVKVRYGGGLSYFGTEEPEIGFHLKAEVQIPLRQEGNVGLMLGAVYYQPNSDRDFTTIRIGFRLHKRARDRR